MIEYVVPLLAGCGVVAVHIAVREMLAKRRARVDAARAADAPDAPLPADFDPLLAEFEALEREVAERERKARQAVCAHLTTYRVRTFALSGALDICESCGAEIPVDRDTDRARIAALIASGADWRERCPHPTRYHRAYENSAGRHGYKCALCGGIAWSPRDAMPASRDRPRVSYHATSTAIISTLHP